jgi:hypothetical protein
MDAKKASPLVNVPSLDAIERRLADRRADEDTIFKDREAVLESTRPSDSLIAPDAALGSNFSHGAAKPGANFDQKIYFFPPEFHALREELQNNWKDFFETTNPLSGTSPAYCMVFDAPQFIGYCNGMTGLSLQHDTGDVAGICKKFLNAFRKLRGVGAIE